MMPTDSRPRPILIAGPTASGKSALALSIAERCGAQIVNADALQVYDCWRVLSARPGPEDETRAPHRLYGHVGYRESYSVGAWLRELAPLLEAAEPLVIVGGTGLYLTALTRGLAEIPQTPPGIRAAGNEARLAHGPAHFLDYLERHDPQILARIDRQNPMRLQRAWEVHQATGRALSAWQADTGPPLLAEDAATRLLLNADPDWLRARIARRFDDMIAAGALEECEALRDDWDPSRSSARALGATELMAHLDGRMPLDEAVEAARAATRQYAKRQRTWFRANMANWQPIDAAGISDEQLNRITSMG